ncbi:hypothetical protein PG997_008723 [Apiospora hydei]|uniref:Uncharacterized protein n=1 Tax=Apiospora hydei TaxID=1337664 RepID=A0ABR1WBM6_9PEZI
MQFMFSSLLLASMASARRRRLLRLQVPLDVPGGGGFIDNLRGKDTAPLNWCNPQDWQAQLDDAGTGLVATFNTYVGCHGDDVARALHAASGVWTICANDLGANADEVVAAGAAAVGLLADFFA